MTYTYDATLSGTDIRRSPRSAPEERSAAGSRIAGRAVRILIAEDELEMRVLLTESLRRDGFEVLAAGNGLEMIEEIRLLLFRGDPLPIDLIVSDERMPGMPGLEFLSILRDAGWPTPFILITGFGDAEIHERALRLGASAVLDKPFDIEDLRNLVIEILADRDSADARRPIPPDGDDSLRGPVQR